MSAQQINPQHQHQQQQQPAAAEQAQQVVQQPECNAPECDNYSFEDSDRFEEDSLCSYSTEPESLCNNWRGWKRPVANGQTFGNGTFIKKQGDGKFCIHLYFNFKAREMNAY